MKTHIPDDWNGEDWQCIQVQWPLSDKWLAVLNGVLSIAARGRYWDEKSGVVTDAQEVGAEIWRRNTPLIACSGEQLTSDETPQGCGLIVVEGDDDMGQVVTNVTVENGYLKVYFGPCCVQVYKLAGDMTSEDLPDQGEDEGGDEWPEGTADAPTACDKAYSIMSVVFDIVDRCFDALPASGFPWDFIRAVQNAWPNIDFGTTRLMSVYAAGLAITETGLEGETEDATIQAEMLCRVSELFDDGQAGITDEQYDAIDNTILAVAQKWFNIGTYPLTFDPMVNIYMYAYWSIGENDTKNITKYLVATGADCSCPAGEPEYDWTQTFDFTLSDYSYDNNGGLATWVDGVGWVGNNSYDADGSRGSINKTAPSAPTMWDGAIGIIKYLEMTLINTVGFDVAAGYEYSYLNFQGYGGTANEWEHGAQLTHDGATQVVSTELDLEYSIAGPQQATRLFWDTYHAHIQEGAGHVTLVKVVIKGFGTNPFVGNGTP